MFKEETLFRAGQYNPSPARRKAINYVTFNCTVVCMKRREHELLGSLSNSVFERRTSTGSELFASLSSGLVETLR